MVRTLDNPWWNLDQTLIWIATSDLEQAQPPPEPWLYRRIVKFPSDIAFRGLRVPEGSKTGLHKPYTRMTVTELLPIPVSEEIEAERDAQKDLLAKLSAGLLKIETEEGEVKKAWFAGAEICFDDSGSAYLSRWKVNLGKGPRHYPDRHDPVFLAADVMALFPALEPDGLTIEPATTDRQPRKSLAIRRQEARKWYAEERVANWTGSHRGPEAKDDYAEMKSRFGLGRDDARKIRNDLAPARWKEAGPKDIEA